MLSGRVAGGGVYLHHAERSLMTDRNPTLHMMCGKIAAGKSTLAAALAAPADTLSQEEVVQMLAKRREAMSDVKAT